MPKPMPIDEAERIITFSSTDTYAPSNVRAFAALVLHQAKEIAHLQERLMKLEQNPDLHASFNLGSFMRAAYKAGQKAAANLKPGDVFQGAVALSPYNRESAAFRMFLDAFLTEVEAVVCDAEGRIIRVERKGDRNAA